MRGMMPSRVTPAMLPRSLRLGALSVAADAVEALRVQVGDALGVGAAGLGCLAELLDESAHLAVVELAQLVKGAEARVFGFEGVGFHPAAAVILVKVGAGRHTCIKVGQADAFGGCCPAAAGGQCRC